MTANRPTQAQRHWTQGYERGSVFASLSRKKQKEFKAWLRKHQSDSRALERQLGAGRPSQYSEV